MRTNPRSCLPSISTFLVFLSLLMFTGPLRGQERQVPFDTKGTILEIKAGSPYEPIWTPEVGPFERLQAFESDTIIILEVYRTLNGASTRTRKPMDRVRFSAKQLEVDSASAAVLKRGGELSDEDIEDLRSTFTYDQTGFSSFHGITASVVTESGAMFWIVTGGSYFVLSMLSDQMNVTRANVEAAKYGHLTGLFQGFTAAAVFEAEGKATMALASLGGITHAVASYRLTSAPDTDPTVDYLRMTAERHSLVWGGGIALLALGDGAKTQPVAGLSLAVSASSYLWSSPLFGFEHRRMSWADALLADEFMTPWYLTLLSLGDALNFSTNTESGVLMAAGGVSGYLLGVNLNEGRMRSIGTVKRTRLLMYGGALLGLGIIVGLEVEENAALWVVSGSTWLGYFIGGRFGGAESSSSSSWDVRVMPENLALGRLVRPTPERPFVRPLPVAVLSVDL
jgi:hypothetical protein